MKIAISGAHSTGKSTFIRKLAKELEERQIKFKLVSDLAVECPLPILRKHTVESTLWIASKNIADEIAAQHECEIIIVDRPILDCWAYFIAVCESHQGKSNPKLETLRNMIINWLPTYDIIYQTVINKDILIEDAKERDLDEAYRDLIGSKMKSACSEFGVNPKPLTYYNADIELENIIKFIEAKTNKP